MTLSESVLSAYSGQSMNFIAGALLLFFPTEIDKAFWLMVALVGMIYPILINFLLF
jgi:hypothetical protein